MSQKIDRKKKEIFSKQAYVDAAVNIREGFILQAILEDGKSYAKDDVIEIVKAWKSKEVK